MRECPYCKEEIKENAVICRFCRKRVKGRWTRRFIAAIIIIVVAVFIFSSPSRFGGFGYEIRQFVSDISEMMRAFVDLVKTAPKDSVIGIKAIKEHQRFIDEQAGK